MTHHHRPLSPHVGIYRWQITNTLSILHRVSGVALFIGSFVLAAWLWTAAYDGAMFKCLKQLLATPVGLALLGGFSAAFYYHLGNGIRHLCWDTGRGFALSNVTRSGWFNLLFTLAATAVTWWLVCPYLQG
jgi:succinate dehydrogenase / fumarate reductase cytochrome b subunit